MSVHMRARVCFTAVVDDIRIRRADRDDAFIVAALVLQMDRGAGERPREGFVNEYADAWLSDFDHRPTWLACLQDGTAVGLVQAGLVRKLPSLRRPTTAWMHVSLVYVRPSERGHGLAERMLQRMISWGSVHGVERYQLNAVPEARSLYERLGFRAPSGRLMELRVSAADRITPFGR